MPFVYSDITALLKKNGYSTYRVRKENLLSQSAITSMKRGGHVDTHTLARICKLCNCQPGDFMEYVPSDED